jgi:lysophospholipase L1-like esterase
MPHDPMGNRISVPRTMPTSASATPADRAQINRTCQPRVTGPEGASSFISEIAMRRNLTILFAALLAAVTGLVTAVPANAKPTPPTASPHSIKTSPYVALGDSYSAASGVFPQVDEACGRSLLNYPHEIARILKMDTDSFIDVTCGGATTAAFTTSQAPGIPPQLDAVNKQTRLVTMTIGGNDGDAHNRILTGCVNESLVTGDILGNPCEQKFGSTFTDLIANPIYPQLVQALNSVRRKAPAATVVILGYPRVMPDKGDLACYPSMPISMGDVPYVTHWEETLNDAIRKAAAKTGARYVDMWPSSNDRDACEPAGQRWIEPLIGAINASPVHPNALGEAAMADQTLNQLGIAGE